MIQLEPLSHEYERVWKRGGKCYICGRLHPPWALGDTKRIGLVRFRKKNHLANPVLFCRSCLRRAAHIAIELKVFDVDQEFLADENVDTE